MTMIKRMKAPCGRSQRNGHRHRLTWMEPHKDHAHQRSLADRCNSQLLWATAARQLLLDRSPALDGKPLSWPEAREYLAQWPQWRRGLPPEGDD